MVDSWVPNLIGQNSIIASPIYMTGEESIRLSVLSSLTGQVISLSGRYLPIAGPDDNRPPRVDVFSLTLAPTSNRVVGFATMKLGECFLLDFQVRVSTGTPLKGQTYAIVTLGRGDGSAFFETSALAAGYVTAAQRLGPTDIGAIGATDGAGVPRAILGTVPGAGAEIVETVPTGARWQVQAFAFTITTSAAVANRSPVLTVDDGANVFAEFDSNGVTAASLTSRYVARAGLQNSETKTSANLFEIGLSPLILAAGSRIRTVTGAIQAGDQYTAPRYLVTEWLEI